MYKVNHHNSKHANNIYYVHTYCYIMLCCNKPFLVITLRGKRTINKI